MLSSGEIDPCFFCLLFFLIAFPQRISFFFLFFKSSQTRTRNLEMKKTKHFIKMKSTTEYKVKVILNAFFMLSGVSLKNMSKVDNI